MRENWRVASNKENLSRSVSTVRLGYGFSCHPYISYGYLSQGLKLNIDRLLNPLYRLAYGTLENPTIPFPRRRSLIYQGTAMSGGGLF